MGQPARIQHNKPDAQKYQRRAVIPLYVDGRSGQQYVQQHKQQVPRPVHLPAHPAQMQRQRQDKADFRQLGGLKGHAAHTVPAVVGGAARVVADRQKPGVDIVQKEGGQHQPPRHHAMQRPGTRQRMVVCRGKDSGKHHPQQAGNKLDRGLVVGAKLRLADGHQHHNAEHRAGRTEQQHKQIYPAQIPAYKRIHRRPPSPADTL